MKNNKFEEQYFEGWFHGAVGKFSQKDLELSKNWFFAWIEKLSSYVSLKRGNGKKVLEIGCSIGGVASLLDERGFDVTATDISNYSIKKAKKLLPHIKFKVLDVEQKINLKEKYDLVIAFEVVEHLESPQQAIINMKNVLKKNGTLVFSTPYPYSWAFNDPTHVNVRHPKDWIRMMKNAGFKSPEYHKFTLIPYFYRLNRKLQIAIPFHLPSPYTNTPIFYIAKNK